MHSVRRASSRSTRGARRPIAIAAARCAAYASGLAGGHATALPGFVAERIDPELLADLGSRHAPVVLVIGTNGKTTTTRLLATILEGVTGRRPVSNRSGANLSQGVLTALLRADVSPIGPSAAVFEVDELAFPALATALRPDVVVVLNLVRDQLDRYGEVDLVERRWAGALRELPSSTTIVACADDPRMHALVKGLPRPVRWFGLADPPSPVESTGSPRSAAAVAVRAPCPNCGGPTDVDDSTPSRGVWRCAACGHARPAPDLAVRLEGTEDGWLGLRFELRSGDQGAVDRDPQEPDGGPVSAHVRLSGAAGAHDAGAAVLAAIALGLPLDAVVDAIDGATPAFGRLEEVDVDGRTIVLSLAKNPSSVAQAAETAAARRPNWVLLGLGDRAADGRDVSWIWDARLDALLHVAPLTLTGSRADDLALRFKYAAATTRDGLEPIVDGSIEHALTDSLRRVRAGGTLMVLATYTTLLAIRAILEQRGVVPAMPR